MSEEDGSKTRAKRELAGRIQTCDICRLRHQKCNSAQPCYHCEARGLDCRYTNIPTSKNKGRKTSKPSSSVESTTDRDTRRNDSVIQLILQEELSSLSLPQPQYLELVDRLTRKISRRAAPVQPIPQPVIAHSTIISASPQHLVNILGGHLARRAGRVPKDVLRELEIIACRAPPLGLPSAGYPRAPSVAMHSKEQAIMWIASFLQGLNSLIGLVDPLESRELLDRFYSTGIVSRTEECNLTYQLAVGARFGDQTPEWAHCSLYDRARAQFERCVELEEEDTWTIQPILLSCIYLMSARPRVCRILLGTAIRIAQQHRIDLGFEDCPIPERQEYDRMRGIWRSIYFLDSWNSMLLGRLPQLSTASTQDSFLRGVENSVFRANNSLFHNVALLAIMNSMVLRDIYAVKCIEPATFEKHINRLEGWARDVSEHKTRMRAVVNDRHVQRQAIATVSTGYLELLYHASTMLASLPALQYSFAGDQELPLNLRFIGIACLDSAVRVGHVTETLISQGVLIKRSEVPIVLNFYAAIVILIGMNTIGIDSSPNIQGTAHQTRKYGMVEGLRVCLVNLEDAASQDQYAKNLYQIVESLKDLMKSANEFSESSSDATSPQGHSTNMFSIQSMHLGSRDRSSTGSQGGFTPFAALYGPETSHPLPSTPASGEFSHFPWNTNSSYSHPHGETHIQGPSIVNLEEGIINNPYAAPTHMAGFHGDGSDYSSSNHIVGMFPFAGNQEELPSLQDRRQSSQYSYKN